MQLEQINEVYGKEASPYSSFNLSGSSYAGNSSVSNRNGSVVKFQLQSSEHIETLRNFVIEQFDEGLAIFSVGMDQKNSKKKGP